MPLSENAELEDEDSTGDDNVSEISSGCNLLVTSSRSDCELLTSYELLKTESISFLSLEKFLANSCPALNAS